MLGKVVETEIFDLSYVYSAIFKNELGKVLKVFNKSEEKFSEIEEVYISETKSGVVKGWKLHTEMKQNFTVISGEIKLVVYDDRESSKTRGELVELTLSPENFIRVHVPNNLWYSFKAVSSEPAQILNCSTMLHNPSEVLAKPLDTTDIPYSW